MKIKKQLMHLGYLIFFSLLVLTSCTKPNVAVDAKVIKDPIKVRIVEVATKSLTIKANLNGRVSAYAAAQVRPRVTGILEKRFFKEGQQVKKGDLLYEIDDSTFKVAMLEAKANFDRAKVTLEQSKRTFLRYEKLLKTKSVSLQDFDDAKLSYDLAKSDLNVAYANLEKAKLELSYTKITSPISGTIGKTSVLEGSLLTENQSTALAEVVNLDKVYVDLMQPARSWRNLQENILSGKFKASSDLLKVSLTFDDGMPYAYDGVIELFEPSVDESTGNINLRATFDNPNHILLPGMSISATVTLALNPDTIVVQPEAVIRDPKGQTYVFSIDINENKAYMKKVTLGYLSNDGFEILDGITAGEYVAIEGLSKLKDNSKVEILNTKVFDDK